MKCAFIPIVDQEWIAGTRVAARCLHCPCQGSKSMQGRHRSCRFYRRRQGVPARQTLQGVDELCQARISIPRSSTIIRLLGATQPRLITTTRQRTITRWASTTRRNSTPRPLRSTASKGTRTRSLPTSTRTSDATRAWNATRSVLMRRCSGDLGDRQNLNVTARSPGACALLRSGGAFKPETSSFERKRGLRTRPRPSV